MLRPAWLLLLLLLLLACILLRAAWAQGSDGAAPKVLRQAFPAAETSFDPAQVSDVYSRTVIAGIFEAPLEYAYLSNPARLRPNTAAAMPQVDDEQRSFTSDLAPLEKFTHEVGLKEIVPEEKLTVTTANLPSEDEETRFVIMKPSI